MIPHILTNQSLTVLLDSRSIAIPRSHANFTQILEHLNDNEPDELRVLLDVKQAISNFTSGRIAINDRILTYDGQELDTSLTRKIIEFMREGDPKLATPLINFLDKVMLNPSRRAVQGLFDWVSASNMPIAEDGDIYAWKIVGDNYFDYHSGTLDHTPGNVVSLPRNQCDEDPDQTCSAGIHFCSFSYLPKYRNNSDRRVMLVRINPMNVVAIPRDYNNAKGRCCELLVVQQVPESELEDFFPKRTVYTPSPNLNLAEGQVWRTTLGHVVQLVDPKGSAEGTIWAFHVNNPFREVHYDLDGTTYKDDEGDLEVLIPEDILKFQVGQVWIDSDGDEMTITDVDLENETIEVVSANGTAWDFNLMNSDPDLYLVSLKPTPKPLFPLTEDDIGQNYLCRDGKIRTVTSVQDPGEYAIVWFAPAEAVYASNGKVYLAENAERDCDIIEHVPAIDWTQPLEDVNGQSRVYKGEDRDGDWAVVSHSCGDGWFYDKVTGEHAYGNFPRVRNAG